MALLWIVFIDVKQQMLGLIFLEKMEFVMRNIKLRNRTNFFGCFAARARVSAEDKKKRLPKMEASPVR